MKIEDLQEDPRRKNLVTVDPELCMGCKKCLHTCCYGVYEWDPENKVSVAAYDEECVACYQCMYFCPAGAITVKEAELAFYDQLYDPVGMND
ncbi:4Fe-4S dicluster domain-containing protein [Olsenella sp. AM30-3LB]|uniref:4Fe-4S dicluster domain-containing protein n=1 Tax=Olsenella sp. AM30-3LB TaxID=2292359 RepID=UPI000E54AF1E|nr:4Fe-4S dicluster domain-containing protein [Olsenella sp. AM30-3LB]RHD73339.1 4Fe-4S dicluster domain-containing protein [Olsenella sp. AM30-3LB]